MAWATEDDGSYGVFGAKKLAENFRAKRANA